MITTLYNQKEVMLAWLRQQPSVWNEYLLELRDAEIRTIKQTKDLVDLGRSQGKLELLDRLIGLREELQK